MASATEESKVHQMVGRGGTGPAGWRRSLVPKKSGYQWGPEQEAKGEISLATIDFENACVVYPVW